MANGYIKHVFPGGNTSQGFFSYYDYIIPVNATRIFVIKGGPGVGKSTFMKKIGESMVALGYSAEFHHCSSDNNSLDGVVIPALQVAFIDGTAPHIVDPKNPGCVDEILHLGDFWDETKMVRNKEHILECNREVGKLFQRAYKVLRAAKAIYDDWEAANGEAMNYTIANQKTVDLLDSVLGNVNSTGYGNVRKLFASAITPNGPVNYLESVVGTMPTQYVVTGAPGTGKATMLHRLMDSAVLKGLDVEAYYCPLDPSKIEHLLIPAIGVAVTTAVEPHKYIPDNVVLTINMNECLQPEIIAKYSEEIAYNQATFQELFEKAISYIQRAKKLHDVLETYYVPNMDFDSVQKLWEKTMARVVGYAKV